MLNIKIFLLFVTTIQLSACAFSQGVTYEHAKKKAQKLYDEGNNYYAFGKYTMADSLLKQAIEADKNFIEPHWLLGNIYLESLKKYEAAATEFKAVETLQPHYNNSIHLKLGYAYFKKGDFDEAKKQFTQFSTQEGVPAMYQNEAKAMLKNCDFAKQAIQNPVKFKPINLGDAINGPTDDLMPALTADEHFIYFTRLQFDGKFAQEDIYKSEWIQDRFSVAEPLSEKINTFQYNEGAHCISPSGKYLFFTSCDRPDRIGGCDIYMAKKVGTEWDRAKNLGEPINTPGWDTQPCISADGKTLFFVSKRIGSLGGSDIFYSVLSPEGVWQKPVNLGPTINTENDEERPFIHPDGNTLYFSSKGHAGMGGADLFVSRKQADSTWGKPVNLGFPINTAGDEIGIYISTDGKTAYFASEQPDTKGGMDIYKFEMPESIKPNLVTYTKGIVFDSDTKSPLSARIQFFDLEAGTIYSSASSDNLTGQFLVTLPAGKNYACQVSKEGYLFHSENFSLKDIQKGEPFLISIGLKKIKVGESVVMQNIFFETNKSTLKEDSKVELNTLLDLLNKNPKMKIEIGGHTDKSGLESDNQKLSEERAKSVYDYLVSKSIPADRLSYKGYAASQPIAANETAAGKAKNRRTEFKIISVL